MADNPGLLQDLVVYVDSEMPTTSLLICGDFNFVVSRPGLTSYFRHKECEIFPKRPDRKRNIDFVLVRGKNINVLKCEQYHPSRPLLNQRWGSKAAEHDDARVKESQQPDNTVTVGKDGHDHDKQLWKVKQEKEDGIDYFSEISKEEEKKDGAEVSIREITDAHEGSIGLEAY